jgi:WD40 repeat protein
MSLTRHTVVGLVVLLAGASPAAAQRWAAGVVMSPDGGWIVGSSRGAGPWRNGVSNWRTNQLVLEMAPASLSNGAAFSSDSKKLAHVVYTDKGRRLRIVELPGGKELATLEAKLAKVIAFSAGDTFLVIRDDKDRLVLLDPADGKERAGWAYRRLPTAESGFVLSPDRKTLALLGKEDGALKLIDLVAGKELPIPKVPDVQRVAYQPDGARLMLYTQGKLDAKAPPDRQFVLLDARTGKELSRHKTTAYCRAMALSAEGRTLVVYATPSYSDAGGEIVLWNTTKWFREGSWQETRGRVTHLAFSLHGHWLAFHIAHEFRGGLGPRHESAPHVIVRAWGTGRERAAFASETTTCNSLTFGPGGQVLIIDRRDDTQIVDLSVLGQAVPLDVSHDGPVMALAASPDGKTLASAGFDRVIRLWDPETKKVRKTLLGHRGGVLALGFSPDGKTLASASADRTVRLWDPATGKTRTTLKGHAASVWALSFSKDGVLATGAFDGTVKLWDVKKGEETGSFSVPTWKGFDGKPVQPPVGALAFSPDGRRLAVTDGDPFNPPIATLYLYDLAKRSVRVASRITQTERQPYIAGRALLWRSDGKAVFCGPPITVTAWNVERNQVERSFGGGLSLALADNALVIGQGDQKGWWPGGTVRLVDPLTGAGLSDALPLLGTPMSLAGLGGGRIAIGGFDGSVVLWTVPQSPALKTSRK